MVLYLTHITSIRFITTYKTHNAAKVYTKSGTESKLSQIRKNTDTDFSKRFAVFENLCG